MKRNNRFRRNNDFSNNRRCIQFKRKLGRRRQRKLTTEKLDDRSR